MLVQDDAARAALARLKVMMVGGEAFPPALAAQLRDSGVGRLLNMYGPTETTIWSTVHEVGPDDESIPIGKPIANNTVYVLDPAGQPVPQGVAGELYIGGAGWRAATSAGRSSPPSASWRTASAARAGGCTAPATWCAGATTGYSSSSAASTTRSRSAATASSSARSRRRSASTPGVREAVVIPREDVPGDVRLVAYLVAADPDAQPSSRELKEYLREHLPEAMVPSHFIALERFPADAEQEDRPQGAAGADGCRAPGEGGRGRRRAGQRAGGEGAGGVAGSAAAARDRYRGQLLRPGRALVAGGESAPPVERDAGALAGHHRPVPLPDGQVAGGILSDGGAGASLQGSQDRAAMRRQAMAARRGGRGRSKETPTTS
jgi:hypothetical protein